MLIPWSGYFQKRKVERTLMHARQVCVGKTAWDIEAFISLSRALWEIQDTCVEDFAVEFPKWFRVLFFGLPAAGIAWLLVYEFYQALGWLLLRAFGA